MLFFTIYGFALSCMVRRVAHVIPSHKATRVSQASRIGRVAAVYSVCFLVRAAAFGYRVITSGCMLPNWFFWTVGYYLPEIITCGHIFVSYFRIERSTRRAFEDSREYAKQGKGIQVKKPSSAVALDVSVTLPQMWDSSSGQDSPLLGSSPDPASLLITPNAFTYSSSVENDTLSSDEGFDFAASPSDFPNGTRARTAPLPFQRLTPANYSDDSFLSTSYT